MKRFQHSISRDLVPYLEFNVREVKAECVSR